MKHTAGGILDSDKPGVAATEPQGTRALSNTAMEGALDQGSADQNGTRARLRVQQARLS